jgi:hypothetical protein
MYTNEATETSSVGDGAPGSFMSAYYFILFSSVWFMSVRLKHLLLEKMITLVIATNIHVNRMARIWRIQGSMQEWKA